MTLVEVAEFLFVSRVHVKKLVASGKLEEVLPRNPYGTLNIDVTSVEKYKATIDAAKQAWLDSQIDDAPS
ncbi:hypothetical protein [Paraburkholderia bannensis]|uniref:hypothetical protein n=1 Tax=Paraburkholderia bannensis TaxID=765414 RepID=UPI002ABD925F|nr:hypothetical protein [Paraburkholderia bannensis]